MLKIINLRAELTASEGDIKNKALKATGASECTSFRIVRRAIDARRKSDVHYTITAELETPDEAVILKRNIPNVMKASEEKYSFPECKPSGKRPLIVGSGPAGLFCALYLARAGFSPILIERGADVDSRSAAVKQYWKKGFPDTETNVQFGEGGAGTFSDGKLNTGTKDIRIRAVLEDFVRFGASEDILVNSKPHIGTDVLRNVVKSIRNEIISLGGEVRFLTKLVGIKTKNNAVCAAVVKSETGSYEIEADRIILAVGHSARDTFKMLKDMGVRIEKKPFAIGARIEHKQDFISEAMYGNSAKLLPPADYKLAVHTKGGRGVFSFCMCPGGYVVAAASEYNSIVTNGMSYSDRAGENANSAILVGITPEDFPGNDVLAGMYLQQEIERKAYLHGKGMAPAETVNDFLKKGVISNCTVTPTYKPGVHEADISAVFPYYISEALSEGLLLMEKKIKGFTDNAILTAPETRSSSPIKLVRGADYQLSVKGLYSAGEGGGHAGGITSSAVDGIKAAEMVAVN